MNDCNNCRQSKQDSMATITLTAASVEAHEHQVFQEKLRLWTVIIILSVALLLSIGLHIFDYVDDSQYEVYTEEIIEDTYEEFNADASDGGNAVINGDGSVNIGG